MARGPGKSGTKTVADRAEPVVKDGPLSLEGERRRALAEAEAEVAGASTARERIAALRRAAELLCRLPMGISSAETIARAAAYMDEAGALARRVQGGEVGLDEEVS